ncbi:hypothetical protein KY342_01285 [Candidatus Woesearchaeota archaeon]|nr:hypothetical protein [Candidatus Woesearchaeota archaeon]
MLNKKKIGGSHIPEDKTLKRIRWIEDKERKAFEKEYKDLINNGYIFRQKKKTGKGSDWHISLNPKRLKDLYDLLQ